MRRVIHTIESATMPSVECTVWRDFDEMAEDFESHGATLNKPSGWCKAFCTTLDLDGRTPIVCLFLPEHDMPEWELHGLIAHEAVHGAFRHLEDIGEDHAGEEELAYLVQAIYGSWEDLLTQDPEAFEEEAEER